MKPTIRRLCALLVFVPLTACDGAQSVLSPRGGEAIQVDPLFWTITIISAVVVLIVTALVAVALLGSSTWRELLARKWLIWVGGIITPVVVLSFILVFGLSVLAAGNIRATSVDEPAVTIIGKQWWWEVRYRAQGGGEIVSANELRLPTGRPISIRLVSDDVIHSFWVPHLAGKLDMIPGRVNILTVEADEPGVSRGQCAEYCGGAHALMSLYVIAMSPEEYATWLAAEMRPARMPQLPMEREGQALFLANGCGACHAIRGTDARGTIGPDLTHVGSRMSLAAASLPNNPEAFARWIVHNQTIKPENQMPAFQYLDSAALQAIAVYLDSLE